MPLFQALVPWLRMTLENWAKSLTDLTQSPREGHPLPAAPKAAPRCPVPSWQADATIHAQKCYLRTARGGGGSASCRRRRVRRTAGGGRGGAQGKGERSLRLVTLAKCLLVNANYKKQT